MVYCIVSAFSSLFNAVFLILLIPVIGILKIACLIRENKKASFTALLIILGFILSAIF